MKSFAIICTVLLATHLFLGVEGECDVSRFEGRECARYTCHDDGSITAVGCGTYRCAEGQEIGYKEDDLSKPYPECCGGPICKK